MWCISKLGQCSSCFLCVYNQYQYEPPHDKTNKMVYVPSEDSDQSGHLKESSLCAQWVAKDPSFLHADSDDSDQTGRMPRLIWVFAGRTCRFVGFVMRQLTLAFSGLYNITHQWNRFSGLYIMKTSVEQIFWAVQHVYISETDFLGCTTCIHQWNRFSGLYNTYTSVEQIISPL